ncbi:STAS domain-containing protein [Streptomyces sp. NPDC059639]|uniref:STAS domain-containing protein n=1 Tax=Streptomyces sp. NPDC059639 TaxID=3346891 RepID=UPI0036888679
MSSESIPPILSASTAVVGDAESMKEAGTGTPGDIIIRSCATVGPALWIELQGEVDHLSARPLRTVLAAGAVHGIAHLSIDAWRVTFADSALLNVLDRWSRHGRSLHLRTCSPAVRRLMEAARRVGRPGTSGAFGTEGACP